jgi:hypothetical protein
MTENELQGSGMAILKKKTTRILKVTDFKKNVFTSTSALKLE